MYFQLCGQQPELKCENDQKLINILMRVKTQKQFQFQSCMCDICIIIHDLII